VKVGLKGEKFHVYTEDGSAKVQWKQYRDSKSQPLTWYKVEQQNGKIVLAQNITQNFQSLRYFISTGLI